jgi:transcriptional regulator with XRE-family HTH domain
MSTFYDNVIALCAREKVSPSAVAEACGVSRASVTKWKNGSIPRDTVRRAIADYFGVTVLELETSGAFSVADDEKPADAPLEWAQDEVEAGARAARRCQIIDRTAGMTLAQLEQIIGLLDVMFPAEG